MDSASQADAPTQKKKWPDTGHLLVAMVPAIVLANLLTPAWEGYWKGRHAGAYADEAHYLAYAVAYVIFVVAATIIGPKPRSISAIFYGIVAVAFALLTYYRIISEKRMFWEEGICAVAGSFIGIILAVLVGLFDDRTRNQPHKTKQREEVVPDGPPT